MSFLILPPQYSKGFYFKIKSLFLSIVRKERLYNSLGTFFRTPKYPGNEFLVEFSFLQFLDDFFKNISIGSFKSFFIVALKAIKVTKSIQNWSVCSIFGQILQFSPHFSFILQFRGWVFISVSTFNSVKQFQGFRDYPNSSFQYCSVFQNEWEQCFVIW